MVRTLFHVTQRGSEQLTQLSKISMPLLEEQWDRVLSMTREHIPSVDINRWLIHTCKISFTEAAIVRAKARDLVGLNVFDYAKATHEPQPPKPTAPPERPLSFQDVQPLPQPKSINDSCVSCGNENFDCSCDVKRVDDITF